MSGRKEVDGFVKGLTAAIEVAVGLERHYKVCGRPGEASGAQAVGIKLERWLKDALAELKELSRGTKRKGK